MTTTQLDNFTRAYVECALWSSNDNANEQGGEPLDANYSVEDIDEATLARMAEDCAQFRASNEQTLRASGLDDSRAGFLFWLNRNGHGSGFWDEYSSSDAALHDCMNALSEDSHTWGSFDLYVGDDGKIYGG